MAGQEADPESVVSHNLGGINFLGFNFGRASAARRTRAYWTPERMAAAIPVGLESDASSDSGPRFQGFGAPMLETRARDSAAATDEAPLSFAAPAADFETAPVADRSKFPFSAVGKLYMTLNRVDGAGTLRRVDSAGSAWVIGDRAIFTAGHCVFAEEGNDSWAGNVLFVPQYHHGRPIGTWTATSLHTLAGWTARGADMRAYDLGAAVLDGPIAPTTGAIGWLTNPTAVAAYLALGYPRDWLSPQFPFDGEVMWGCLGRAMGGPTPRMANNLTRSASGGPWLVKQGNKIYASGLTSFRPQPLVAQSPRFGRGFLNLVETVT